MTETQRLERIAERLERASELALARGSEAGSASYREAAAVGGVLGLLIRGEANYSEELARVSRLLNVLTNLAPEDSEEQRLADSANLSAAGLEEEDHGRWLDSVLGS